MTYAAFAIYPIVVFLLFSRMRFVMAIPSAVLVGLLTLPARFTIPLPVLPDLDKETWVILVTTACAIVFAGWGRQSAHQTRAHLEEGLQAHAGWIPRPAIARYLLPLAIVGPLGTWLTNQAPVVSGGVVFPGLGLTDFLVDVQSHLVFLCLFLISWKYLGSERAHRAILLAIAVAGLIYTLPTLYEIRMSPQIHVMVYGYFPHSWLQHVRGDGFRPLVLMPHALELAAFLCVSALATIAYMRATDGDRRILYFFAALWVIAVMVAGRSVGPALIAATILPFLFFAPARVLVVFSALVAVFVLSYPIQRAVGFSPMQHVADAVQVFAPGRAGSLEFRLNAEDLALQRALEKPFFGWGGWGRMEVIDDYTGRDLTVFDGVWLIRISRSGIAGFLLVFGLLAFPLLQLAGNARQATLATAGISILLAANLFDLIPNSSLSPITIMLAGAVLGRLQWMALEAGTPKAAPVRFETGADLPVSAAQAQAQTKAQASARGSVAYARARGAAAPMQAAAAPQEDGQTATREPDRPQARYTRFKVRSGRRRLKGSGAGSGKSGAR